MCWLCPDRPWCRASASLSACAALGDEGAALAAVPTAIRALWSSCSAPGARQSCLAGLSGTGTLPQVVPGFSLRGNFSSLLPLLPREALGHLPALLASAEGTGAAPCSALGPGGSVRASPPYNTAAPSCAGPVP